MAENWSPTEALRTLDGLAEIPQRMHARVAGMTWMIWGLAFAFALLIDITDLLPAAVPFLARWLIDGAVTLAPLLVAAFLTARLWESLGVAPDSRLGSAWSMAWLGLLVPLLGALVGGPFFIALSTVWPGDGFMSVQAGLVGYGIWAVIFGYSGWSGQSTSIRAAWAVVAVLLVIDVLSISKVSALELRPPPWLDLLRALVVMAAFTMAGIVVYRRG